MIRITSKTVFPIVCERIALHNGKEVPLNSKVVIKGPTNMGAHLLVNVNFKHEYKKYLKRIKHE